MSDTRALDRRALRVARSLCAAIVAGGAVLAVSTVAQAYSGRVVSACKTDFKRFCPSYKVGSSELKACMRSAGGNISTRCIDALADSGEISSKYHSRNRRK